MATFELRGQAYEIKPLNSAYVRILLEMFQNANITLEDMRGAARIIQEACPDLPEDVVNPEAFLPIRMSDIELAELHIAIAEMLKEETTNDKYEKASQKLMKRLNRIDPKAAAEARKQLKVVDLVVPEVVEDDDEPEDDDELDEEEEDEEPIPPPKTARRLAGKRKVKARP